MFVPWLILFAMGEGNYLFKLPCIMQNMVVDFGLKFIFQLMSFI
jgi:hypothetical protein